MYPDIHQQVYIYKAPDILQTISQARTAISDIFTSDSKDSESLGYEYLKASNKTEFLQVIERFLTPEITKKPMLLELKTTSEEENEAHKLITTISTRSKILIKTKEVLSTPSMRNMKSIAKNILSVVKK